MVQSGSVNMRVNHRTHSAMKELSESNGISMQSFLDNAVEAYRRKLFLEALNEEFSALRRNPENWQYEKEERRLWDQSLSDDLEGV